MKNIYVKIYVIKSVINEGEGKAVQEKRKNGEEYMRFMKIERNWLNDFLHTVPQDSYGIPTP